MATQKAEEEFMVAKSKMQNAITVFYESCGPADIDDAGFMEDVNDAVLEASGHEFEVWSG